MIDQLDWEIAPEATARKVMAKLVGAADPGTLAPFDVHASTARLPFYKKWRLILVSSAYRDEDGPVAMEDLYALWREGREPLLLDGQSAPIHAANDDESLQLTAELAPDYVRFFCYFLRAHGEAFILYERVPEKAEDDKGALQIAHPLTPKGTDDKGNMLFDATIIFTGSVFKAVISVPASGELEMVDDDPQPVTLAESAIPEQPDLELGPVLRTYLTKVLPAGSAKPPTIKQENKESRRRRRTASTTRSDKSAIVQMVELLLDRALVDQAQNRLIGYFNATLPTAKPLDQFAALMMDASPVVIVETNIPFVEETISQIINARIPPVRRLDICSAAVPGDNIPLELHLPLVGPALVLLPLQVYRNVAKVERIAFDIAGRDLAAIVTCERFSQLPESLRQIKDVVLRLPALDAASFEMLFQQILGEEPPVGWRESGTEWVKHLLSTDFEHPRRMHLPREKAFAYVHAQVTERLSDVDPEQGLSLNELHGLGEARQFAEDLIADIHAAVNGQLPWSQVDRGALLVGAPGTGKTTLAKAIAKDCGVRFIKASAAGWQAAGESLGPHIVAIRRTFSEARNYAPSILFIDEIDSLGNREEFAGTDNAIYQTEVVNAVLEEMEGLDPTAPVVVIGATNHEGRVDPALRRSGRMDRVIRIPRPNSASLEQIYRYYLDALGPGTSIDPAMDIRVLGRMSVGMTGADVERIVRGAARRARKNVRPLSQFDIIDEITNKPRSPGSVPVMTADELSRTATHEAGHALAMFLNQSKGSDIGFVSIVPRDDGTLGFTFPLPDERASLTRRDYDEKLEVFVAGRAAEELTYGEGQISGGAANDLKAATELAIRMVTRLGLGGNRKLLWSQSPSAAEVDLVESTLEQSYERALAKLKKNPRRLAALAKAMLDRQELTGDEVRAILSSAGATPIGHEPASPARPPAG